MTSSQQRLSKVIIIIIIIIISSSSSSRTDNSVANTLHDNGNKAVTHIMRQI